MPGSFKSFAFYDVTRIKITHKVSFVRMIPSKYTCTSPSSLDLSEVATLLSKVFDNYGGERKNNSNNLASSIWQGIQQQYLEQEQRILLNERYNQLISKSLKRHFMFVAKDRTIDKVVGFLEVGLVTTPSELSILNITSIPCIGNVVVNPAVRRLGIGKLMMNEALGTLRSTGEKYVICRVRSENFKAIAMYQDSFGFTLIPTVTETQQLLIKALMNDTVPVQLNHSNNPFL